jgi:hypothetical protein
VLNVAVDRSGIVDDDFMLAAVFGWDDEEGSESYLVISVPKELDPQEIELGHAGLHVELNDQANGAYRAIKGVRPLSASKVEIALTPEGMKTFGEDLIVLSGRERDSEAVAMLMRLAQATGVGP